MPDCDTEWTTPSTSIHCPSSAPVSNCVRLLRGGLGGYLALPRDVDLSHIDYGCIISRCAYTGHIDETAGAKRKPGLGRSQNTYATGSITGKEGGRDGTGVGIEIGNNGV